MASKTVERKIYFFRLEVSPNEDGSVPRFSTEKTLQQIQNLRFLKKSTNANSRYARLGNSIVCAWPTLPAGEVKLVFGRIRRDELPQVENSGKIAPLPIKPGESIVDSTHIQFFSKNIVGAEFNFHGPRASTFGAYCRAKILGLPVFHLSPLLGGDAANQLNELQDIRLLSVKVRASQVDLLAFIDKSIPSALRTIQKQFEGEAFDIVIRPRPRQTLRTSLIGIIKNALGASANPIEDFDRFSVKGKSTSTDRVETFDLLKDRFIAHEEVVKVPGRTRAVDSKSMFFAIAKAYNEHRNDLEKAAAMNGN